MSNFEKWRYFPAKNFAAYHNEKLASDNCRKNFLFCDANFPSVRTGHFWPWKHFGNQKVAKVANSV